MRNIVRRLQGKPVELSPKQEEKMRKAYERAGLDPDAPQPSVRDAWKQSLNLMKDGVAHSVEQVQEAVGETFDDRRGVLDPGAVDLNKPPAELEDPAERERIAATERAARDAARAPYRAADAPVFTRFATTGNAQLQDVATQLQAFDPADVYGVYRVPDRLGRPRSGGEGKAQVEWEIAHRAGGAASRAAQHTVHVSAFPREAHVAARQPGEPSVLDEDVAGELARRARLEPEESYGLTRLLQIRGISFDEGGTSWSAEIEGVLQFTRTSLEDAQRAMAAEAPLARLDSPFHLEILDWEAVAAYNSPFRWGPARVPAPLPHLPTDFHELLTMYLEVVGLRPEDCYGVQATRTREGMLADLSLASFKKNLNADKSRCHATEHLVLTYRDSEAYREGRERWAAYQRDVLRARLDHLSGAVRAPIEPLAERQSFLSELFDFVNPLDPMQLFPTTVSRLKKRSLGPYCGVE
jgi:hypothetical protein